MSIPRSEPLILKKGKDLNDWKAKNTPDVCPLCNRSMTTIPSRNRVVDHDHKTGAIRGVMCRNCNSLEGKVHNICVRAGNFIPNIQWLRNLIQYWIKSASEKPTVYYPGTTVTRGIYVAPKVTRKRRTKTIA